MRTWAASTALLAGGAAGFEAWAPDAGRHQVFKYGPQECVSLSTSPGGSCVISTNCPTKSLGDFEFAFVCVTADHKVQKHSFGVNSLAAREDYDTKVKCAMPCAPPTLYGLKHERAVAPHTTFVKPQPLAAAAPAVAPAMDTSLMFHVTQKAVEENNQEEENKESTEEMSGAPSDVASYFGPQHCVRTFRNQQTGTCMMETWCNKVNSAVLKQYQFGLTCVGHSGESVRHVFGKDSFNRAERFDTLIPCALCLGTDEEPGAVVGGQKESSSDNTEGEQTAFKLNQRVGVLESEIKDLEGQVKQMKRDEARMALHTVTEIAPVPTAVVAHKRTKPAIRRVVRHLRHPKTHHAKKVAHHVEQPVQDIAPQEEPPRQRFQIVERIPEDSLFEGQEPDMSEDESAFWEAQDEGDMEQF